MPELRSDRTRDRRRQVRKRAERNLGRVQILTRILRATGEERALAIRTQLLHALAKRMIGVDPTPDERAQLFGILASSTSAVAVDTADGMFFVSTVDAAISRALFVERGFDRNFLDSAVQALKQHAGRDLRDTVILDIGANIGTVTIPMLTSYGAASAIVFEPASDVLRLLEVNLVANGLLDNVDVRHLALTDEAGFVELELCDVPGFGQNWGDRRIRKTTTPGDLGEHEWITETVRAERLDAQAVDWEAVGAVFMDVQGHEASVLAGGPDLLESTVPVVTEYSPYMLTRASGLDKFHRIVETHFSAVVDVRTGAHLPAKALASLAEEYRGAREHTDLLLVR